MAQRRVKYSARSDKRKYIDEITIEAKKTAKKEQMNKVYEFTRKMKSTRRKIMNVILAKNGDNLTKKEDIKNDGKNISVKYLTDQVRTL